MELRIALVPLARVHYDMKLAEEITRKFRAQLILRGLRVVANPDLVTDLAGAQEVIHQLTGQDFDLLLILQATFADSTMAVALAEAIDRPIFLWSIPEERTGGRLQLNSLCGANLAAHALTLRNKQYEYAYARLDDRDAFENLKAVTAAARVFRLLRSARIGVVGTFPAGMDTCFLDAAELNARLGLQVVPIDLQSVFERVRQIQPETAQAVRTRVERRVSGMDQVDQPQLLRSLGAYHVLQEIANEEKLAGMAIRCWPEFFTELQCSACGALSLLSDERIPSSCEADVNGTVTQLALQWLSEAPAFGSDIVSVDYEEDSVVLWHCGQAPLSMADPAFPPRASVHPNRQLPLLMEFPLRAGRVTLARLSRASGELRWVVSRGEMLSAPPSFSGTSGVVRFERPARQVLNTILGQGLEHHISLTYGDHFPGLLALAKMLRMPVLQL
jgi:L-fucose isomerase-like protein